MEERKMKYKWKARNTEDKFYLIQNFPTTYITLTIEAKK